MGFKVLLAVLMVAAMFAVYKMSFAMPSVDLGNMDGTLKLTKEKCLLKDQMEYLQPKFKKLKWLRAKVVWLGENREACYTITKKGEVMGFDEGLQTFQYNIKDFKDDTI